MPLGTSVLDGGGDEGIRTLDLSDANRTLSHTGQFLVNWSQGKPVQSVIFQGVPGVCRPVFPFRFDAADAAASAWPGAWHLCRAYKLRPAGC